MAYLNHGSYGAVPISVQDVQNAFIDRANSNPNHWFRYELPQLMIEARHIAAYWFGVAPEHFGFVPNASQGVVTAVQALVDDATSRDQQTHLVATSLGYGGVLYGMQHIASRSNATYAVADLVYPHDVTTEVISSRIRALLPNNGEPMKSSLRCAQHTRMPALLLTLRTRPACWNNRCLSITTCGLATCTSGCVHHDLLPLCCVVHQRFAH